MFSSAAERAEALWADVRSSHPDFQPSLATQDGADTVKEDEVRDAIGLMPGSCLLLHARQAVLLSDLQAWLAREGSDHPPVQPGLHEVALSSGEDSSNVMGSKDFSLDEGGVEETPQGDAVEHAMHHPAADKEARKEDAASAAGPQEMEVEEDAAGVSMRLTATNDGVVLAMEVC